MTKPQWAQLTEKQQWDTIVALRGPDSNYGETLKWFTTSVIRGQMAPIMRVGGLVNTDLKLVVLPNGGSEVGHGYEGWNHGHFCQHISEAAVNLGLNILWLPASDWHKVMRMRHIAQCGEAIITAAEKAAAEGETSKQASALKELRRHLQEGIR